MMFIVAFLVRFSVFKQGKTPFESDTYMKASALAKESPPCAVHMNTLLYKQ